MIRYILLNPGDIGAQEDEILILRENCLQWMPVPQFLIGRIIGELNNPLRRPLSRDGLVSLAKEAERGESKE